MFDGWLPSRVAGRVDKHTMHWQYLPMLEWCGVSSSMVQWLRKLPWNQRAVTRAPVSATISPAAVCLSYSLNSSLINTFINKAPWKSPNISRLLCLLAHRRYKYKIAVNLFFFSFFFWSLQTHSLTHRRAVPGRRKHFDILLAEHKGRPKEGAKDKDKDATQGGAKEGGSQSNASQETASPSKPHCPNGRPLSTLKLRLANAYIPR